MKTLLEVQRAFGRAVRGENIQDFADMIIPCGGLDSISCLKVYRDDYFARLESALGETFETVWRMLGDEAFFAAAEDFVKCHYSVSHNLTDYGDEFPEFLGSRFENHPYLVSLAKFELAFRDVFHAAGDEPHEFSKKDLENAESLSFKFTGSAKLLSYEHSVFNLWDSRYRDDFSLPSSDKLNARENLLLYRRDLRVFCEPLNIKEYRVLNSLFEGNSISEALSVLDGYSDVDENFISELFARIAGMGIISGIRRKNL